MGQDIETRATIGGKRQSGRAQLETDYLLWRGKARVKIPFKEMRSVEATDGELSIVYPDGEITLDLGARASRWADKILNPPTVLDKLGVKEGQRVSILGAGDGTFASEVSERTDVPPSTRVRKDSDIVFLFATNHHELARVDALRSSIKPDGSVWVMYPKGKKEMTENDVIEAGRAAGMKDVKVVRFSDTHTGLKMVIPVSDR